MPLPPVFRTLEQRQARIYRGQLTLVVGPAGAGKSLLTASLLVKAKEPALALILDQDQLTAAARFAAIATGDKFLEIKDEIDDYRGILLGPVGHIQAAFRADDMDDIRLQMRAYEERYGAPPVTLLVDNLGNLTSGYENEWAMLKALTLELDQLARDEQCAVIACHHTTDLTTCEPAARDKILGKVSQYPRLILSVGFNPETTEYKVAAVKNSSGPSDVNALNPAVMWANPERMGLTEQPPVRPHPQVAMAQRPDLRVAAPREYRELRERERINVIPLEPKSTGFGGFRG